MFTVIRSDYIYCNSFRYAALECKQERGFGFVCSDENRLERISVTRDVRL